MTSNIGIQKRADGQNEEFHFKFFSFISFTALDIFELPFLLCQLALTRHIEKHAERECGKCCSIYILLLNKLMR
jgi:hypothetical protein